ncbi:hypothetical protein [Ramlibacter tataouinensis]|uniref:DUF4864 domain-containing protein n=1 Tax=Ramlibacter tataouinensis (strain ATCC BAA-407 / DSM 14655 / LMG 21543 / TTB310) TaxID=365046 RepID=F5XZK9_RAMTT|nr:hypothetical protein [Ramlibacter tataouinensis]AEG92038.1 Hypothetical protein Rta_09530 [Ramlibacter tataouinensis TTB310]
MNHRIVNGIFAFLLLLVSASASAATDPQVVYERVKTAAATSDMSTYFKYSTAKAKADFEKSYTPAQRASIFKNMGVFFPTTYSILSRKEDKNQIEWNVEGVFANNEKAKGTMKFIWEDGDWKFDRMAFRSK